MHQLLGELVGDDDEDEDNGVPSSASMDDGGQ